MLLAADKLRNSFFKESLDTLRFIFERQGEAVQLILIIQTALQIGLHAAVDGGLRQFQGRRTLGGDLFGHLLGRRHELIHGHHPIDQTEAKGLLGADDIPRVDQLFGPAHTDEPRQPLSAASADATRTIYVAPGTYTLAADANYGINLPNEVANEIVTFLRNGSGQVIWRNNFQPLAPSMAAASYTTGEIILRPAVAANIMMGKPYQVAATSIKTREITGSSRQRVNAIRIPGALAPRPSAVCFAQPNCGS